MKIQLIDEKGLLVGPELAAMPVSLDSGMRIQITDEVCGRYGKEIHPDALISSMIGDAWVRVTWDAVILKYEIKVVARNLSAAMNCWRASLVHVEADVGRVVVM